MKMNSIADSSHYQVKIILLPSIRNPVRRRREKATRHSGIGLIVRSSHVRKVASHMEELGLPERGGAPAGYDPVRHAAVSLEACAASGCRAEGAVSSLQMLAKMEGK
jgi:hypothetical protein